MLRFTRNDGLFTTHHSRLTKAAFTLAETLIIIGIIGVVAALTLPNLNHATGDKETVTRVMKAYSMLSEATDRAMARYGGSIDEWDCSNYLEKNQYIDICWLNRIKEYLKVSKSCNEWPDSDSDDYVSCESLRKNFEFNHDNIIFQLADGLTLSTEGYENCDNEYNFLGTKIKECSIIYIDIDGPNKGKNKKGYDIFNFALVPEGIYPGGENDYEDMESFISELCYDEYWARGFSASYWIVNYGNLDYLKADEEGVCPNGTQLSETVTSCN